MRTSGKKAARDKTARLRRSAHSFGRISLEHGRRIGAARSARRTEQQHERREHERRDFGRGRVVTVFGGRASWTLCRARAGSRRLAGADRLPQAGSRLHLQPQGRVGQVMAVQAICATRVGGAALRGASAVVNLVGILPRGEPRNSRKFRRRRRVVAEAAKAAGIDNVVHISAIGADPNSASNMPAARRRGGGRARRRSTAVILRPP